MKLSRLARRMFTADIWAPLLLALFVAVVSGLVTLAPRALAQADAEYLASRVGEVSAVRGDLRARWDTEVAVGGSGTDDPWGVWFDSLNRLRAAQPEPLRGLLGSPQILAHLGAQSVFIPQGTEFYQVRVTLTANPEMTSQFELVSGRWPQPGVSPQTGNVEVVLPDDVAARIGKRAGDALGEGIALVGTVRIADPAAPRWRFDPSLQLEQEVDPNNGTAAAVAAFMAPEDLLNVAAESGTRVGFFVWYPLDAASLAAGRVSLPELRTQLVGFQSDVREVVPAGALEPALKRQEARFDTGLTEVLDGIVKQQRTTASLVAVVVAGPVGVAVALMLVAARMVLQRHRATLVITRSRGASPRQLRVWAAGWGLLAGMPAALLGHLAATLLVPFDIGAWQWLPTILAGLLPAAMLALGVEATTPTGRKDLSVSGGGRWRIAAEVAVLAGAALACWQLFTRDAGSEAGIDWLATLTPLVLAAAGCVVALRFYPLPLTGLVRWFRRSPRLTGFLGATRALRAPAAGGVPAMAVVLGAAVAVAGVGLFGTVSHGARAAGHRRGGGRREAVLHGEPARPQGPRREAVAGRTRTRAGLGPGHRHATAQGVLGGRRTEGAHQRGHREGHREPGGAGQGAAGRIAARAARGRRDRRLGAGQDRPVAGQPGFPGDPAGGHRARGRSRGHRGPAAGAGTLRPGADRGRRPGRGGGSPGPVVVATHLRRLRCAGRCLRGRGGAAGSGDGRS